MRHIYDHSSPIIALELKAQKFRIKNELTEQLVKSLVTKIFYTLAHYRIFDTLHGSIDLGEVIITPYRSVIGDVRFILDFVSLSELPISIQWNGKVNLNSKTKHSGLFINVDNFDVTENLDSFVEFEQRVVTKLHDIETLFFSAERLEEMQVSMIDELKIKEVEFMSGINADN